MGSGVSVNLLSAATVPSYDVLTAGSFVGTPTLLNSTVGRTSFAIDNTALASNIVRINVSGGPASLRWDNTGAAGDGVTWDTTNVNWKNGAANDTFFVFDAVTFDDTNNGHYNVAVNSNISPGNVLVNASGNYQFTGTGSITGLAGITKNGSGALTLANPNTYTGDTTLHQGTLNINDPSAIGAGRLVINGGTIDTTTAADIALSTNNPQTWAASFTFTGTKNLNLGTGAVTLNGSPTVTVNAGLLTVGGNIGNGTGNSFSKSGAGVLLLSGASTFTGSVNVLQGTLGVQSASVNTSPLGSTLAAAGNSVTISSGTTLDLTGPTANTLNFGQKQFFIAGTGVGGVGAILNNGLATTPGLGQQNAFQKVTLTADATINTIGDATAANAPGRIDIRATQVAGANVAILDLAGFTLTKNGTSFFGIVNTDVTPGNIVVNSGIFQIETTSNVPGGAFSGTITYNDGTYASFFGNTGDVSRSMIINGNVNMGTAQNSVSTIASNITLNGALTVIPRNANGTGTLTLTGNIAETGGSCS